jgi:hypothetical protein
MLCGTGLFSRHREGAFRLRLEGAFRGGELAVVAGALLLQKDGAWFEVVESGAPPR